MAVILQRVYNFPEPSSKHPFTDVKNEWFADSIAALYASGITNGISATQFGPKATIKREQFAAFLARSIDETFRIKQDIKKLPTLSFQLGVKSHRNFK